MSVCQDDDVMACVTDDYKLTMEASSARVCQRIKAGSNATTHDERIFWGVGVARGVSGVRRMSERRNVHCRMHKGAGATADEAAEGTRN